MGLRDKLKRLESVVRGNLEYFELLGGSRFYYDAGEVYKEVFLHGIACLTADSVAERPEPPEVYHRLTEAKDPAAVLERLTSAEVVEFPYEVDALLNERRLVPLPHEPVPDLSEP